MFSKIIIRLFLNLLEEILKTGKLSEVSIDGENISLELDEKFLPRKLRGTGNKFNVKYEDSVKIVDLDFEIQNTIKITGSHKLK